MKLTFEEACSAVADLFEACPEMWTCGSMRANENGDWVQPHDHTQCKWCAIGGLEQAGHYYWTQLDAAARALGYEDVIAANDEGGRLVAIRMLRMAAGEL